MISLFLSSGLFLGWSLGANDAANVFGTAVGTKMIRFKTAAIIASIFVIIGSVVGGTGTTHTLGKLGAVNAIAGSFTVALAAAFTVFWMTKLKLPVSTTQAIVGAIMGWNFFTDSLTDYNSLLKIVSTWIFCPILAALFAMILFGLVKVIVNHSKTHLLRVDMRTRLGLILVGAFGSYSLGANNIANVMGVFVPAAPFKALNLFGFIALSGAQILFLIGGLAIAIGILTYSAKVMETVGGSLLKLSPMTALIVVLSESLVLFLFSSEGLEQWLLHHGLPTIPLVPVSSSQAVVGAVIGIGLLKGGRGIRYKVLTEITGGWVSTPIIAGIITFMALFFVKNVFDQQVSEKMEFQVSNEVISHLKKIGLEDQGLTELVGRKFINPLRLQSVLQKKTSLNEKEQRLLIESSRIKSIFIEPGLALKELDANWLTPEQLTAVEKIIGKNYFYQWQLFEELETISEDWKLKAETKFNKAYNQELQEKRAYLVDLFLVKPSNEEE